MKVNQIIQNGKCIVTVDGVEYKSPKNPFGNSNIMVANDRHVYANYHELKNGNWKITFMAIINCLFC